jgi:hypothetical protein
LTYNERNSLAFQDALLNARAFGLHNGNFLSLWKPFLFEDNLAMPKVLPSSQRMTLEKWMKSNSRLVKKARQKIALAKKQKLLSILKTSLKEESVPVDY